MSGWRKLVLTGWCSVHISIFSISFNPLLQQQQQVQATPSAAIQARQRPLVHCREAADQQRQLEANGQSDTLLRQGVSSVQALGAVPIWADLCQVQPRDLAAWSPYPRRHQGEDLVSD